MSTPPSSSCFGPRGSTSPSHTTTFRGLNKYDTCSEALGVERGAQLQQRNFSWVSGRQNREGQQSVGSCVPCGMFVRATAMRVHWKDSPRRHACTLRPPGLTCKIPNPTSTTPGKILRQQPLASAMQLLARKSM